MKLVAVDNHVIVWGIREIAEPGQEDMIPRTKAFFDDCKNSSTRIIIPSVVLSELLTAIESKHHPMVLNLIEGAFHVAPFDAAGAAVCAKLWQEKKAITKELQDQGATRQELKADCMIVATAIAHKALSIYSHDDKLTKFAGASINVLEIPRIHIQTPLDMEPLSGLVSKNMSSPNHTA